MHTRGQTVIFVIDEHRNIFGQMRNPNNHHMDVTTVWLWNWNGFFFFVGHFVKCNKYNISIICIIWCFLTLRLTILPLWIRSFVSCSICVLTFCYLTSCSWQCFSFERRHFIIVVSFFYPISMVNVMEQCLLVQM